MRTAGVRPDPQHFDALSVAAAELRSFDLATARARPKRSRSRWKPAPAAPARIAPLPPRHPRRPPHR